MRAFCLPKTKYYNRGSAIITDIYKIIQSAPNRINIVKSLLRANSILTGYNRVAVSVSGGADSDCVLDLLELAKPEGCELKYIFFDTGLEFTATKRHLDELEGKYGVTISRLRPVKTVAAACREYGVPFISKEVSEYISRLQAHEFDWRDSSESATTEKYGRCKSALDWYFERRKPANSSSTRYSIGKHKLLREFIISQPPGFKISDKCCDYAKKEAAKKFHKEYMPNLEVNGMRQAEGGRRAGSIRSCFTSPDSGGAASFRPLWYWNDEDKAVYKEWRGLRFSDCYEVYGLKRTGCAGCPCNSRAEQELSLIEPYEPKLVAAARAIFGDTYNYKRQYIQFKK